MDVPQCWLIVVGLTLLNEYSNAVDNLQKLFIINVFVNNVQFRYAIMLSHDVVVM